jgi:hypothetical protein
MDLQFVESSMIQAFGYDEDNETLLVIFNSGKAYQYSEVPKQTYEELLESDSKGSYMRSCIIDCYPYTQMRKR